MVRNEKNSRGDSIAERYGPPVTASDVEDLLYRERVPAASIYKIMQAVRAALSWHRSAAVRPWAGELEDGLTRQEDRRAEQRRARLAEALREEGRAAAAAASTSSSVNSTADPREALGEALADAWATAASTSDAAAPGRPLGATLSLVQGGAGTITRPAPPEPATAVSDPTVPFSEFIGGTAVPFTPVQLPVRQAPPADAPARPAAAPQAVADPAPGPAVPPAPPEPATAPSEARRRKRCTKCGQMKVLDDFQRDKRASDERRPSCKICSSQYDALRRGLKKSLHASTEAAVDEAVDAMEAADEQPGPIIAPQEPVTDEQVEDLRRELNAVMEEFRRPAGLPPDTRDDVVVLIPRFSPPEEEIEDEPGIEGDPDARACDRCGILKGSGEYYTRADRRLRARCKECERRESNERRLAKKARGDTGRP